MQVGIDCIKVAGWFREWQWRGKERESENIFLVLNFSLLASVCIRYYHLSLFRREKVFFPLAFCIKRAEYRGGRLWLRKNRCNFFSPYIYFFFISFEMSMNLFVLGGLTSNKCLFHFIAGGRSSSGSSSRIIYK